MRAVPGRRTCSIAPPRSSPAASSCISISTVRKPWPSKAGVPLPQPLSKTRANARNLKIVPPHDRDAGERVRHRRWVIRRLAIGVPHLEREIERILNEVANPPERLNGAVSAEAEIRQKIRDREIRRPAAEK